jgi:hypothetical protein
MLARQGLPSFSIQITQFAIIGSDLARIDLGMMSENVLPPLPFVNFLEVNVKKFLILCDQGSLHATRKLS